jgi:hypothetical protein
MKIGSGRRSLCSLAHPSPREGWGAQFRILSRFRTSSATYLGVLAVVLLAVTLAFAHKEFEMPKVQAAANYPAHESHPNELVTVGIDIYTGAKASIFKQNYAERGMVPVLVVITNNGDKPIELANMNVQLITVDRHAKIEPASEEDIFRRFSRTEHRGDEPSKLPFPLPGRGPKVGVKKDVRQEVEAALFQARAVEAHSTQSGFMFFDVSGIDDPLTGARLYFTGLRNNNGQELMYFEISLDKAK